MFLHLTLNSFKYSSRILKECDTAAQLGWQQPIVVAALWEPGLQADEMTTSGVRVWRVALRSRAWPKNLIVQVIKYFEWAYKVIARMRREELTIIHAHNITTLPAGVMLKWATGAPLVYDAHELESEVNGLSRLRSRLTRITECLWIRGANRTLTVCDGIADWYQNTYQIPRPAVVRNIPVRATSVTKGSRILRDTHGIGHDELLFLYQGALSPGRGIENLIALFRKSDAAKHLVFMGYGVLERRVLEASKRHANIHFQPAVPPDEVAVYTSGADVGICLIENTCLSYYYSLPNKFFEYLLCGLPVMINDMPEQRKLVERFSCGWVVPASSDQQGKLLASIDKDAIDAKKAGAARAAQSFGWEQESERLRDIYLELAGQER